MKKIGFILIIFIHFSYQTISQNKPNHKGFDKILSTFVDKNGKVKYKSLKVKSHQLDLYLENLEKNYPTPRWTQGEKMAYWLNAYNAYTLKMILNRYPTESITKLYNGKPWEHKWIKINNKILSLDNIEHDTLRGLFKDPRIHFAVNCASNSCPPLPQKAFTSQNLETLLTQRTTLFLNSAANNITSSSLKISKILDWYKSDFGDVIKFISKYHKTKINKNASIEYLDYDWNLNEQK